jgi:hypothetical protein
MSEKVGRKPFDSNIYTLEQWEEFGADFKYNYQIAEYLNIAQSTLYEHALKKPEIKKAINEGRMKLIRAATKSLNSLVQAQEPRSVEFALTHYANATKRRPALDMKRYDLSKKEEVDLIFNELFHAAADGEIETEDANRIANLIKIRADIKNNNLDERVEQLEKLLEQRNV